MKVLSIKFKVLGAFLGFLCVLGARPAFSQMTGGDYVVPQFNGSTGLWNNTYIHSGSYGAPMPFLPTSGSATTSASIIFTGSTTVASGSTGASIANRGDVAAIVGRLIQAGDSSVIVSSTSGTIYIAASGSFPASLAITGSMSSDGGSIHSDGAGNLSANSFNGSLNGSATSAGSASTLQSSGQPLAGNDGGNYVVDNNGTYLNSSYASSAGSAYATGGNADYASSAGSASYAYNLPYNGQALAGNDGSGYVVDDNGNYLSTLGGGGGGSGNPGSGQQLWWNDGNPLTDSNSPGDLLVDSYGSTVWYSSSNNAIAVSAVNTAALQVGSSGSSVVSIPAGTGTLTLSSLAAGSGTTEYIPLPARNVGNPTVFWSPATAVPAGFTVSAAYMAATGTAAFQIYNPTGSDMSGTIPVSATAFSYPTFQTTYTAGYQTVGITSTGSDLWCANNGSDTILVMSYGGSAITTYATTGSANNNRSSPDQLVECGGNMWLTQGGDGMVTELSMSGSLLANFPSRTGSFPGWTIGICSDGTSVWVPTINSGTSLWHYSSSGTLIGGYAADFPNAVCYDGAGHIWTYAGSSYSGSSNKVDEFALSGSMIGSWSVGSGAPVNTTAGIVADGTNVWISDPGSNTVYEMTYSGSVIKSYAAPNCSYACFGAGNDIWIGAGANTGNQVYLIEKGGAAILSTITLPADQPNQLTFDGTYMYSADYNNSSGMVTKFQ